MTHQLPFSFAAWADMKSQSRLVCSFFEVSCADGTNVVRVFREAISLAIKNKEQPPDEVLAEIYALLAEDDRPKDAKAAGYEDSDLPVAWLKETEVVERWDS